jgi:hypothetical protein
VSPVASPKPGTKLGNDAPKATPEKKPIETPKK